jgi:VWFA-related protein
MWSTARLPVTTRALLGVVTLTIVTVPLDAQEPFRAGAEIVPIYATVRGLDGHLVTDLEQADFSVLDRGEPISLTLFSNQVQPLTVAVMVDLSGSVSAPWHVNLKQGLLAFVDELGPNDRARIGTFTGDEVAVGYHLTSDRSELKRVVNEEILVPATGGGVLWNAVGAAMASLENEPGRRVVLMLTNATDDRSSLPGFPGMRDVERSMQAGNYMVYAVALFEGNSVLRRASSALNPPRLTLQDVVNTTGGGFFRALPGGPPQYWRGAPPKGYLAQKLAGVVDELRHQYLLGFVPRHRDGRLSRIEVRVNRSDATVTARRSYRAPREGPR